MESMWLTHGGDVVHVAAVFVDHGVDDGDLGPGRHQTDGQVGADEAAAAGDEDLLALVEIHVLASLLCSWFTVVISHEKGRFKTASRVRRDFEPPLECERRGGVARGA